MIERLYERNNLSKEDLIILIKENFHKIDPKLKDLANLTRQKYYGNKVFIRGLIEFSNVCKNNCYYCGIRRGNKNIKRYRLTKEEIIDSCSYGYQLGFKTFVLQGGEDIYFTDYLIEDIIYSIKNKFPECAVTLSLGEKPYESYKRYFDAGGDRYLLRHETATESHYKMLHPKSMTFQNRKKALYDLKEIGFQVGAGFMVGSPFQTIENLCDDLIFLKELNPHMVGLGPFIPHRDSKFAKEKQGSLNLTILMIALVRLLLPKVLLPATTALGTIDSMGRERGLKAGANVVMPNLSPRGVRRDYNLYDNKISTGDEAAECRFSIEKRIKSAGFELDLSRGDYINT